MPVDRVPYPKYLVEPNVAMVHYILVKVLVVPFKLEAGFVGGAEHSVEPEVGLLEFDDAVGVVFDVGGGIVAWGNAHVLVEHVGDILVIVVAVVFAWVGHAGRDVVISLVGTSNGWKWRVAALASKPAHSRAGLPNFRDSILGMTQRKQRRRFKLPAASPAPSSHCLPWTGRRQYR